MRLLLPTAEIMGKFFIISAEYNGPHPLHPPLIFLILNLFRNHVDLPNEFLFFLSVRLFPSPFHLFVELSEGEKIL